jgi:hypothetical protein
MNGRTGHLGRDPIPELRRERPVRGRPVGHRRERRGDGGRHPGDPGGVLHPGATLPLPVVAARIGGDRHAPAHVEGTDARRAPELVGREREEVHAQRRGIHGEAAHGLTGIGVETHACRARETSGLRDLLDRAELVVGMLDRCQEGAGRPHLCREPIQVDPALSVDGDDHDLEPVGLERVSDAADRRVLCCADHDPGAELTDRANAAPDRQRDRLGPARGEHDLVRLCSDRSGDLLARFVQQGAGRATRLVDREGIAVALEGGDDGVARFRQHGSRRRGVEVEVGDHRRLRVPGGGFGSGPGRTTGWRAPVRGGARSCTAHRR